MSKSNKKNFTPELYTGGEGKEGIERKWFVHYYAPDLVTGKPKRIRVYGNLNSIEDIQQRYARAHVLMDEVQRLGGRNGSHSALLDELANMRVLLNAKTYSGYSAAITLLHTYLKSDQDRHLSRDTAISFLLWLKKRGKSDTTVYNYKLRLSAVYGSIKKRHPHYVNPFADIDIVKRKAKSLQYFTPAHINRIKLHCENTDPQLWLAIQLMYYCFIRPGEMRLLKYGDLHTDLGFIEMRDEISKNGKTEKVVIPEQLLPVLRKLHGKVNEYIFTSIKSNGEPIGVNTLYERFKKVLQDLEIKGRYSFYSWKHTGAVMAVEAGINIKHLQLQLRHSSLEITDEYLKNMRVLDSDDLKHKFPSL